MWTNYWLRYDQNISNKLVLKKLYETACILGSFVVVDPFLSDEKYNPYLRKCCILGSVYTGIGRFENLCDPNETEYQATLTECINVNHNNGLCHHICTNEAAPGQMQDFSKHASGEFEPHLDQTVLCP